MTLSLKISDVDQAIPKTLSAARILHTQCLARLWLYAEVHGILIRHEEGYVVNPRLVYVDGVKAKCKDAVHMYGSMHYLGLACDHVVMRADEHGVLQPVTSGDDPAWQNLGVFWKGLHSLCRWGGDFESGDVNHMSLTWRGVE